MNKHFYSYAKERGKSDKKKNHSLNKRRYICVIFHEVSRQLLCLLQWRAGPLRERQTHCRRRREMLIKAPMLNTELHKNLITAVKHVYDAAISITGTRVSRSALCSVPEPGANHRPAPPRGSWSRPSVVVPDLQSPLAVLPSGRGIDGGQRSQRDTLTSPSPPPPLLPLLTPSSPSLPSSPFIFCRHLLPACSSSPFPLNMLEWGRIRYSSHCVCVC